jgi:carboxyl-terminal processing protease
LALPTGAYYTWKGSVLEGTPIEPDQLVEFDWRERRGGTDAQLEKAIQFLESGSLAQAS